MDTILSYYQSSLKRVLENNLQEIRQKRTEEIELKYNYILVDEKETKPKKKDDREEIELMHQDDLEADEEVIELYGQSLIADMDEPRQSQLQIIQEEFANIMRECSRKFTETYEKVTNAFFDQVILRKIDPYPGLALFFLKLMLILSERATLFVFYHSFLTKNTSFTFKAMVTSFANINDGSQKSFQLFGCFGDLLNPLIEVSLWRYWWTSTEIQFSRLTRTYCEIFKDILLNKKFIKKYRQVIPGLKPEIYEIALDTALVRTRIVSELPRSYRGFTTSNLYIFIENVPPVTHALQLCAIFITFSHEFLHYLRKCKCQTIGDVHLIKTPPNELHNSAEGGKIVECVLYEVY